MKQELKATVLCVNCEHELPPSRRDSEYCCAGCGRGCPCICSYDEQPRTMINTVLYVVRSHRDTRHALVMPPYLARPNPHHAHTSDLISRAK